MSNYRTHTLFNFLLALPICGAVAVVVWAPPFSWVITAAAVFIYGTLFMNPDLDLAYQINPRSIRGILAFPFRGYAMIFRHRGLSHSLLFGTLTRLIWLGLWVVLCCYLYENFSSKTIRWMRLFDRYEPLLIAGSMGLFLADASHLLLDKLHSLRGKSQKRR